MKAVKVKSLKKGEKEIVDKFLKVYKVHYILSEGTINGETILKSFTGMKDVPSIVESDPKYVMLTSSDVKLLLRVEA